jgi:hypothetical protein
LTDWTWDASAHRYRNAKSGQWVSQTTVTNLRDDFAAAQRGWADQLAHMLADRQWTVNRWELEIRSRLKSLYVGEYMLGRGGKNAMTSSDYGRVGQLLREQYAFLRGFALEVQAGTMSEAQIAARTHLYHKSSVRAFETGKVASYSATLTLPAMPGDGQTPCLANCHCRWRITETKKAWRAYWIRTGKETCIGCIGRSVLYNPYTVQKE